MGGVSTRCLPQAGAPFSLDPIRVEQGRFRAGARWIVPRFYSVFHAPALVRDGRIDELRRLYDRAAAARCNGVRLFGNWYFGGFGLAPYSVKDADWYAWARVAVDEAAARGLYVKMTYGTDWQVLVPDPAERIRLVERFAHWTTTEPTLTVAIANEARKNGWWEADDPSLLDLVRRFKAINPTTPLGASDPLDSGAEGQDNDAYNAMQRAIARSGVDFLLVHPHRKPRFDWVNHLYGAAQTPAAVGFPGICWIEEPMGGSSVDRPGYRDRSMVAHVAAACVGAMVGAYTYMHRPLENDGCPGLLESAIAADIPGSPDYRFYNSSHAGSPVASFSGFAGGKCRTISNGSDGWAVAYGETDGAITYASGWTEIARTRWQDDTGVCVLVQVSR